MEEEEPKPPFWLQNDQTDHHYHHRHRPYLRRTYSLILTSTSLLILFLVTSFVFIFIVVPTLQSFISNIFKPQSVKKSWDSLNFVLVLFAIVCGFLRKNNNQTETENGTRNETRRFYEDRRSSFSSSAPFNRLRSFNSYPDLRVESSWVADDERWRFYDDTRLLRYRQPRTEDREEEMGVETVEKVTSVEVATAPPQPQPQPPPASRTKASRRNAKRTYRSEMIEKLESNDLGAENLQRQPSIPSPPPPLPLPAERKLVQGKKKRGIATKDFFTSLRGKKKQRQRSVEKFDSILNSEPFSLPSQPSSSAPPPPPPPPPPPSVFHNLFFSKEGKHKKRHLAPVATHKPHLSNKRERSYYALEDNVRITGNESPLIPIPPPPPPPPFKLPAWKFRVHGDFVRVDSISSSSRSESPDLDEVVDSPTSQEEATHCNNSPSSAPDDGGGLFCPSPDVDTKANTFIERFRAGLRMEKMNSIKEKQGIGRSNLGLSDPNLEA